MYFQDCGMQLTDEPDKRCYPLEEHLLCHGCHVQRLGGQLPTTGPADTPTIHHGNQQYTFTGNNMANHLQSETANNRLPNHYPSSQTSQASSFQQDMFSSPAGTNGIHQGSPAGFRESYSSDGSYTASSTGSPYPQKPSPIIPVTDNYQITDL